jgi:gliding motility-associated-like protein
MKKNLFIFFLFVSFTAYSTHNRSGQISYVRIAPFYSVVGGTNVPLYKYHITVTKYTNDGTNATNFNPIQDRCVDTVYFGDNQFGVAQRTNGGSPVCAGCVPCLCANCGTLIVNDLDGYKVKKNIYEIDHIFPAAGTYTIRSSDPDRNEGVHNMYQSGLQAFYIESVLVINNFTGSNSSPVFNVDPIDKACLYKLFTHNPGAYDAEHDSLSFRMSTPRGADGQTVLNYSNPETQAGGTFNIHPTTGILTWNAPTIQAEYNIAFIVEEWRRNTSGNYLLIGSVLRDMQIVARACPTNDPPLVLVPIDTCVEAGTLVKKNIVVSDPNSGNTVTLSGYGGAFSAPQPVASLVNTVATVNSTSGNKFVAEFSWQTSCEHVSNQYYQTTFKAEDNVFSQKLAYYTVYKIRVVPPSVKNVSATPQGSSIKINWDLSSCNPASNPLIAYKVYRKEGCEPFIPDPCQTSIPLSSGFKLIGRTTSTISSFNDNNGGTGLVVGQDYSYLVTAVYKDSSASYGSNFVCAKLKRDVPILLNVNVLSTSTTAGSVRVRWERPLTTPGNLDTEKFPGPYTLKLYYKDITGYALIYTTTHNTISELETSFDHININTVVNSNEYFIEFISGTLTVGSSQKATSVFLSLVPSDRRIDLSWTSKTPWKNYSYKIFKKDLVTGTFNAVANTTLTSYSDLSGINGTNYCYYVQSEGQYSDIAIERPLFNSSQEACATAIDLTPPVTPTLSIEADCPKGQVQVNWNDIRSVAGSDDVQKYVLYYKPTIDANYEEIISVLSNEPRSFNKDDDNPFSGCYAIKAVDINGNQSALSQDFCIDNCPEFELPNIFSPNNDGANDFFKAIKVRQIKEIDLSIVDRWGNPVYHTKNPSFQWDGISQASNKAVSEGTFFYVCNVFEPRVNGITKRVLKGFVQVVR